MYSNNDKLYLQTRDIPHLKSTINKAMELSKELALVLNELDGYELEFRIKEETPVAGTTDESIILDTEALVNSTNQRLANCDKLRLNQE